MPNCIAIRVFIVIIVRLGIPLQDLMSYLKSLFELPLVLFLHHSFWEVVGQTLCYRISFKIIVIISCSKITPETDVEQFSFVESDKTRNSMAS